MGVGATSLRASVAVCARFLILKGLKVETYRKTHKQFFFECAFLRHSYGLNVLTLEHVTSGKWLTEREIEDFTIAYMGGNEI